MVLALLRNTFVSRDTILWKKFYATYVRPHLEYAVAAWNPYTRRINVPWKRCKGEQPELQNAWKDSLMKKGYSIWDSQLWKDGAKDDTDI